MVGSAKIETCNDYRKHEDVVVTWMELYGNSNGCPLCEAIDKQEELSEEVDDLKDKVKELKDELEERECK